MQVGLITTYIDEGPLRAASAKLKKIKVTFSKAILINYFILAAVLFVAWSNDNHKFWN
jgi:hypothetical protein